MGHVQGFDSQGCIPLAAVVSPSWNSSTFPLKYQSERSPSGSQAHGPPVPTSRPTTWRSMAVSLLNHPHHADR
jgi:hypothetical protein